MFARFHRVLILICTFWEELAGNKIYPKSQSFFFLIANRQFSTLTHIKKQNKKTHPFSLPFSFFGKPGHFKQGLGQSPDHLPRAGQWSLPKFLPERPNPSMSLEWDSMTPIPIRARADLYLSDVQTAYLAP